jgi:hypothetical protein
VGSYLFVSFDGLGLQNPDAVRASVEQAVSPDDGSAAVSSYATWRDPLTDAFPAAASVYVYLAGSEEYLPRLRCAASLADAVERLSGVRSTTSAVNLVEMAAGHLGVDPSVEGMSRAQVAQLFLMLDMQSEDFMYQYVSLDRSMMLLVIAMNGDAEALSAVRATAAAFDCNGVTLTVL